MAGKQALVKLEPFSSSVPLAKQAHAGMLDTQDDAGIGATHLGKTHHVIDLHIGVGTHVAQHRQTAGAIGQRIGQTGAHRLLLASA